MWIVLGVSPGSEDILPMQKENKQSIRNNNINAILKYCIHVVALDLKFISDDLSLHFCIVKIR